MLLFEILSVFLEIAHLLLYYSYIQMDKHFRHTSILFYLHTYLFVYYLSYFIAFL